MKMIKHKIKKNNGTEKEDEENDNEKDDNDEDDELDKLINYSYYLICCLSK